MVQKEVRKKTKIYGAAAVLLAIMLVGMIYVFGAAPTIFPPNKTPFVSGITTFPSLQELETYIGNTSTGASSYAGGPLDSQFFGEPAPIPEPATAPSTGSSSQSAPSTASSSSSNSYSTTNVQVAGVGESDTAVTDGQYLYTVSTTQNTGYYYGSFTSEASNNVFIINADPQNPQVISKIDLGNNTEPAGLFLSQDDTKLVVLGSTYQAYYYPPEPLGAASGAVALPMIPVYQADVSTFIYVYDITNKADPVLTRNFTVSGSYFDSRMIGNYVYAVVSQPATVYNDNVTLPIIYNGDTANVIPPTAIYYSNMVVPSYYTFTSFFGINVLDDSEQPTNLTVMMGGASSMYVSQSNIYITYPTWTSSGDFTSIYQVGVDGAQLTFEAQGIVPGYTINQYSMDEYNGYFRIATNWYQGTTQSNNIYVLDSNLTIVGKLEGIAPGEDLYAVRFMEDRAYVVTFHNTDPFFVIDLSNPQAPAVAGQLDIPGYSSYLQPYDADHVIGIGDVTTFVGGVEYNNLKLSLFDVSDINNPVEIANYTVPGNYSTSIALNDPHAFLFSLQNQLLVIPVSITNYGQTYVEPNTSPAETPPASGSSSDSASTGIAIAPPVSPPIIIENTEYWQGAYVFNLNPTSGFTLQGTISHLNSTEFNSQGFLNDSSTYYNSQNDYITRALYIGNTLYTVSNSEVKLTDLTTMTQIGEVDLN